MVAATAMSTSPRRRAVSSGSMRPENFRGSFAVARTAARASAVRGFAWRWGRVSSLARPATTRLTPSWEAESSSPALLWASEIAALQLAAARSVRYAAMASGLAGSSGTPRWAHQAEKARNARA